MPEETLLFCDIEVLKVVRRRHISTPKKPSEIPDTKERVKGRGGGSCVVNDVNEGKSPAEAREEKEEENRKRQGKWGGTSIRGHQVDEVRVKEVLDMLINSVPAIRDKAAQRRCQKPRTNEEADQAKKHTNNLKA